MENKEVNNSFCPRCGAVTENGVCRSCGYGASMNGAGNPYWDNSYAIQERSKEEKEQQKKTAILVCCCIGVLVLALIVIAVFYGRTVFGRLTDVAGRLEKTVDSGQTAASEKEADRTEAKDNPMDEKADPGETPGLDKTDQSQIPENSEEAPAAEASGEKTYGFSPEDDYYKELANDLKEGLDYSIILEDEELKHAKTGAGYYFKYPKVESDVYNVEQLNEALYEEKEIFLEFCDLLAEYGEIEDDYQCDIVAYVTYMDEQKFSIVYSETIQDGSYLYLAMLYSVNVDIKNGGVLDNPNMLEINDTLIQELRRRDEEQNGGRLDDYTDAEIEESLKDPITLILFYTPLGMEIGVNLDDGWLTVTFKDYEKYLKQF